MEIQAKGQNLQTVPNMNKENKLVPSLPRGFQDSWGSDLILKKKLLKIIEQNFIKFGFSPLETSPMEYSSMIGNSLAEDEENPMSDIYTFNDDGPDILELTFFSSDYVILNIHFLSGVFESSRIKYRLYLDCILLC